MSYQPGQVLLGEYRMEELIGVGSFGEVYRVTYLPLNQARALKILRREGGGLSAREIEAAEQRFRREYWLGGQLNSPKPDPHLLLVYEPLLAEDLLGVVLEYAPAGNLKERIERANQAGEVMALETCLRIARDVALGLGRLHQLNIVHRDIKPANILFDQDDRARVGDLGLVQTEDDMTERLQKSNPAPHPGTPGYKSPEQVESLEPLKTSSDVYALGLVLFEMLTGRKYALQRAGIRARELRTDLPAEVDTLLARLLAKNPDDRPNDGREAAGLLERCIQPKLVEPAPAVVSSEPKRGSWLRSWPVLVVAGLILLGLLRLVPFGATPVVTEAPPVPTTVLVIATQTSVPTEAPTATLPVPTAAPVPTAVATEAMVEARQHDGMLMLKVPAGEFSMGSELRDIEKPVHTVTLSEYWIDQTEVTNDKFAKFVQATSHKTSAEAAGISWMFNPTSKGWDAISGVDWRHPQGPATDLAGLGKHPVVHVSWLDAAAYCAWAGARLPTEAEWEKAARGMDGRKYPWGEAAPAGDLLNFADVNLAVDWADKNINDGYQLTAPVGSYPRGASPYGALDMAGNVWEWTADWYQAYHGNTVANADYGEIYRVLRGGALGSYVNEVRTADRGFSDPSSSHLVIGFRCARDVAP